MIATVPAIPAQTIAAFAHESIDIIQQQRDEIDSNIIITVNEIHELKNRQAWIEQILNNLLCRSNGKPAVTCTPMNST
jgi:prefoldin subunit 5